MSENRASAIFRRVALCGTILAATILLTACHSLFGMAGSCHKPEAYAQAKTDPPLKIPPGLSGLDTAKALRIPDLSTPEPPPPGRRAPCLDEPPAYVVPKTTPQPAA